MSDGVHEKCLEIIQIARYDEQIFFKTILDYGEDDTHVCYK